MDKYLENEGIALTSFEDAMNVCKALINSDHAVMITREEDLWIVNWVWCESGQSSRNDVVFRCRASVELEEYESAQRAAEDGN